MDYLPSKTYLLNLFWSAWTDRLCRGEYKTNRDMAKDAISDLAGTRGLYLASTVSGLTEFDAIVLATLRLFDAGKLEAVQAANAIGLAIISISSASLTISPLKFACSRSWA